MGAESVRPEHGSRINPYDDRYENGLIQHDIHYNIESIRMNTNIGAERIRITVNMRAGSIHLNAITETESPRLIAMMKPEIIQGMLCCSSRRHGPTSGSTYVWGLY